MKIIIYIKKMPAQIPNKIALLGRK